MSGKIDCANCKKTLMPGGGISFTGDHTLSVGTPSTLKCAFCNHTQTLSSQQVAALGFS